MAIQRIEIAPGINTNATQTLNRGGWSKSNLIRWRTGLPEKIGGWASLSSVPLTGTARSMHSFTDLTGNNYIAFGTNSALQILFSSSLYYITPVVQTDNIAVSFYTTMSSKTVKIDDASYSPSVGDYISIDTPVSIGGIVLYNVYEVTGVVSSTQFEITAASAATSTVNAGGAVPLFTTTNTSNTVEVTLNNHGYVAGNFFEIDVSTAVGGITLSGQYLVQSVVDANNFDIHAAAAATSSTSGSENGGDVRIVYFLPSGNVSDVAIAGYGSGGYGSGGYGVGTQTAGAFSPARIWSLDNFGQNLVAVPLNGKLYQWVPPVDIDFVPGNEAAIVTNAPTVNTAMFVSMPAEQVVLLGASVAGVQDPLLMAWCDNGVITTWTASATNQAGTYRLSRGSKIVGGLQAQQYGLIWTDIDLWSMQYINQPFIYNISTVAQNCGLIAQNAKVLLNSNCYWASAKGFYVYGGGNVTPLQCMIFDQIFNNLNTQNIDKSFMAGNSLFNEWMYFFPSANGNGEIDTYAKFNVLENLWDYGSLVRTCWIDESSFGTPIGVDANGIIQQHEQGYDADGVPMTGVFIESGFVDVSDGTIFIFTDWLIPDILMTGIAPSVTLTLYTVNYPGDTPSVFGPFTVTPTTEYITVRCRARQMAIKIESDSGGTFWRNGAIRYRGIRSGRVG